MAFLKFRLIAKVAHLQIKAVKQQSMLCFYFNEKKKKACKRACKFVTPWENGVVYARLVPPARGAGRVNSDYDSLAIHTAMIPLTFFVLCKQFTKISAFTVH